MDVAGGDDWREERAQEVLSVVETVGNLKRAGDRVNG